MHWFSLDILDIPMNEQEGFMTADSEVDDDAANDSGDDHIPGQREVAAA